jgi:CrcB protein
MAALRTVLLVGAGGFVGSIGRYLVGGWVHRAVPFAGFPYGTLVVNVLGCLAIGLAGGMAESRQLFGPDLRVFLLIGVLGGFTTFSSFAFESLALARDAELARAFANVAAQVVLGLAAAWLGYAVGAGR